LARNGGVVVHVGEDRDLAAYARIPIGFEVDWVLDPMPVDGALSEIRLVERAVERPWWKDYDALPGNHPMEWARRFDVSSWGVLVARSTAGERLGGVVVA